MSISLVVFFLPSFYNARHKVLYSQKGETIMPYAKLSEASIYFETHGNSGSPLLMINGLGANLVSGAKGAPQDINN